MNERLECSPTLKHRLKHTICGCFTHHPNQYDNLSNDSSPTSNHRQNNPQLTRTTSYGGGSGGLAMMRSSKSDEFNLKGKCRSLMSRIGTTTPRGHHHRKSHSTDFRYDPLSYSLNFDNDASDVDDFPFRNFISRLPPSPSRGRLQSSLAPPRSISDGALVEAASQAESSIPVSDPPPREITAYS